MRERKAGQAVRGQWVRRLPAVLALAAAAWLSGCSDPNEMMPVPALYTGPQARPLFTALPAAQRTPALDLLYFTNRAAAAETEDGSPYGAERSQSLAFGSAQVDIGQGLDWNMLSAESVAPERAHPLVLRLGRVQELGHFPDIPYGLTHTDEGVTRTPSVVDAHEAAVTIVQAEVARRLASSPRKEVVLFIHGYSNQFSTAAFTISELCHYLGREFVCAMFSWPAGGTRGLFMGYNVDRESAEYSTLHLKQTIRMIAETPGLERLHLVAHSRGTDLLVTVVEQLMTESYVMGTPWVKRHKVADIVLLAPDIDASVATAKVFSVMSDPNLPMNGKPDPRFVFRPSDFRTTVYTSPDDRALSVSQWLFGSLRRLGRLDSVALTPRQIARAQPLSGILDFVQVSGRTDLFGHSYFTSNPAVSSDLIARLRYGLEPGEPGRPLEHVGGPFWRLPPTP